MRFVVRSRRWVVVGLVAAIGSGCDGALLCSTELRTAVRVDVRDSNDQRLLDATVHALKDGRDLPCRLFSEQYLCGEQGGGEYEVFATATDGRVQRATITVAADECHTTETKSLVFVF